LTNRIEIAGLRVAGELFTFVADEALPGTGIGEIAFWKSFAAIVNDLAPRTAPCWPGVTNCRQGSTRGTSANGAPADMAAYKSFLTEIGYLVPEGPDFTVTTQNVDPEIAQVAGPQLVVPVMNARYALNAANARWGSLYDALYGTDAIAEQDGAEKGKAYNPVRGARVIAWARNFLDQAAPLASGKWAEVSRVTIEDAVLK
jgi:malate synthase